MTVKKLLATIAIIILAPFKGINYIANKAVNSTTPQLLMLFLWSSAIIYNILKGYGEIKDFLDIAFITIICTIAILFAAGITILIYSYFIEALCFITIIPANFYNKCKNVINNTCKKDKKQSNKYNIEYFIEKDKNKPVYQAKYIG